MEKLHALGAYVSILDVSPAPGAISDSSRVRYFQTDISKEAEVERAVDGTVGWTRESGAQLGGVVNAAGVGTVGKVGARGLRGVWLTEGSGGRRSGLAAVARVVQAHARDQRDGDVQRDATGVPASGRGAAGGRGRGAGRRDTGGEQCRGEWRRAARRAEDSDSVQFEGQAGQAAYAASKGAVRAMTLPLARDLAPHGIRVRARGPRAAGADAEQVATIAPGAFATQMSARMPDKTRRSLEREAVFPPRFGRAEEFAATVRWVLECGYVNGETVRLSGAARLPARL